MATSDTPKSSSRSSHSSFIITMEQLPELKFVCGLFQKQSRPSSFIPSKYPQEALPSRSLNSFSVFSSESPQLPPACLDLNKPTTQEQSRITERSRSFHRTQNKIFHRFFTDSSNCTQIRKSVSESDPPRGSSLPRFWGDQIVWRHHSPCLLTCFLPSRFAAALVPQIPPQDSGNNPRFREAPGKTEGDVVNAFDGHGNTLAFLSHHPKVPPLI
jgi:hypothetical protein